MEIRVRVPWKPVARLPRVPRVPFPKCCVRVGGTLGSVGDDARRFPDEAPPTLPGHSDAFSVFVGGAPASSGLRNARDVAGECGNRIALVDSC